VSEFLNLYLSLYIVFSGPLFVVFWSLNSVLWFTASDWPNDIFKPVFLLSRQEQVTTIKHVGSRWSLDKAMGLWLFFLLLLWKGETMHRSGGLFFNEPPRVIPNKVFYNEELFQCVLYVQESCYSRNTGNSFMLHCKARCAPQKRNWVLLINPEVSVWGEYIISRPINEKIYTFLYCLLIYIKYNIKVWFLTTPV
jgi:hypothetical protein